MYFDARATSSRKRRSNYHKLQPNYHKTTSSQSSPFHGRSHGSRLPRSSFVKSHHQVISPTEPLEKIPQITRQNPDHRHEVGEEWQIQRCRVLVVQRSNNRFHHHHWGELGRKELDKCARLLDRIEHLGRSVPRHDQRGSDLRCVVPCQMSVG